MASPDIIKSIPIDKETLPAGEYREVGYEARQVIDLDISILVTEWRAQILEDQNGKQYIAPFPEEVKRSVQYGMGVKVHAVYLSQYQLIPYQRIKEHFFDQMQIPISAGTVDNFNQDAFNRLTFFEKWVKEQLSVSPLIHADETGINIGGKRWWLHNLSNDKFSYFYPHVKRGGDAIEDIGVLVGYPGIICHDHWKPYFNYGGLHALCNAHHLRELERAVEQDQQQWAGQMIVLLKEINLETKKAGGKLGAIKSEHYRQRYRNLLAQADLECPIPDEVEKKNRGKTARSKSRNLLERLRNFEYDILWFMDNIQVPFSNNQAENDLRMIKVQQKISGCFRSIEGAKIFCRIRSYLTTCRKHGVTASDALLLLLKGYGPSFSCSII